MKKSSAISCSVKSVQIVRSLFDEDYSPIKKAAVDLSNSENPLGCSIAVTQAIASGFSLISKYPEKFYPDLIDSLSHFHNIPTGRFVVGVGANGILQACVKSFVGRNNTVVMPSFSFMTPAYGATAMGGGAILAPMKNNLSIDLDALLDSIRANTRLIFLCNPNNPTGQYTSAKDLLEFAKRTELPVLVSEANVEYAGESLLEHYPDWPSNLIVARSFSKAYGLAGLRVGYGVCNANVARLLNSHNSPFTVTTLSQIAAIAALKDQDHLRKSVSFMTQERLFLEGEIRKLGLDIVPSQANIFLIKLPSSAGRATKVAAKLYELGCSVVDCSAYGKTGQQYIRVSPRKRDVNSLFLEKFRNILGR